MVKLIIDTDPGIDDAMAIFYAAADPEIELLGLTSVFGNVTTPIATRNALRLVEAAGLTCPVAHGAEAPLVLPPFEPSSDVHGVQGFGDIAASEPEGAAITEPAVDFLIRMARQHRGALVLCPIGPLTNIALAIQKDPEFARNLSRIVLMGGGLKGGNITEFAEANVYHDPHAADVVFGSGARIQMIGLDVTDAIQCQAADFTAVAKRAPRLGGMLEDMSRFYLRFYQSVGKYDGCSLHDPAAVIACVAPELFGFEDHALSVSCEGETSGQTYRDAASGRVPVEVAMTVDAAAVRQRWMDGVSRLD